MNKAVFWGLFLFGCASHHQPSVQSITLVKVNAGSANEQVADSLIGPYRRSLEGVMGEAIIYNPQLLQKQQPESALGNLLADIVLEAGRADFGQVDIAMLNYGGIRAALPADTLRIGNILEMLPFNNLLQLVEMDSALLHTFLQHWLEKGGTPLAGVRIVSAAKQLKEVRIGSELITSRKTYRVVMPDYIANGGDGCGFLSAARHQQQGTRLLSEVVIAALKNMAIRQYHLNAVKDGRFTVE